jgi:hypothetical protein
LKNSVKDFCKAFKNLANSICWEELIPKGLRDSLEAKTGSGYIFSWEHFYVKGLDLSLQSNARFLIFHNHMLGDAMAGGHGATLM